MRLYNEKMEVILDKIHDIDHYENYIKVNFPNLYHPEFIECKEMVLWNKENRFMEDWNNNVLWNVLENLVKYYTCKSSTEFSVFNEFNTNDYIDSSMEEGERINIAFAIYNRWIYLLKEQFPNYHFYFRLDYNEENKNFSGVFHKFRASEPAGGWDLYEKDRAILMDIV